MQIHISYNKSESISKSSGWFLLLLLSTPMFWPKCRYTTLLPSYGGGMDGLLFRRAGIVLSPFARALIPVTFRPLVVVRNCSARYAHPLRLCLCACAGRTEASMSRCWCAFPTRAVRWRTLRCGLTPTTRWGPSDDSSLTST
jgi:hypothetical protein